MTKEIVEHLQKIVFLKEKQLARAQELYSKSAGSQHDLECAEIALLQSKIEVCKAKEELP